ETIDLLEIYTEDEDSKYGDVSDGSMAFWADPSPLRKGLIHQEGMNPFLVFGPPVPLDMEQVFGKSKSQLPNFHRRTSSADWTSADRLTDGEM
ncbi:uncharacterized protein B0I36DRAFT_254091, partial [Microdochium trichocladiopsis]